MSEPPTSQNPTIKTSSNDLPWCLSDDLSGSVKCCVSLFEWKKWEIKEYAATLFDLGFPVCVVIVCEIYGLPKDIEKKYIEYRPSFKESREDFFFYLNHNVFKHILSIQLCTSLKIIWAHKDTSWSCEMESKTEPVRPIRH